MTPSSSSFLRDAKIFIRSAWQATSTPRADRASQSRSASRVDHRPARTGPPSRAGRRRACLTTSREPQQDATARGIFFHNPLASVSMTRKIAIGSTRRGRARARRSSPASLRPARVHGVGERLIAEGRYDHRAVRFLARCDYSWHPTQLVDCYIRLRERPRSAAGASNASPGPLEREVMGPIASSPSQAVDLTHATLSAPSSAH